MSLLQTVAPQQAEGEVAKVYGEIGQAMGFVPNAMQLYSISPSLLQNRWQNIGFYMQHPTLSFPLLAMVRMLVSQENDCEYCIGFNEAMLINKAGLTPEAVAATKRNPADAPLDEKDKAMLMLVLKATKAPKTVAKADLDGLRALGWKDSEILDAVHHGAANIASDVMFNTFKVSNDF